MTVGPVPRLGKDTMKRALVLLAVAAVAVAALGAGPVAGGSTRRAPAPDLRLNHWQVLGSHNSYHVEQPADIIEIYKQFDPEAYTLAYTHEPLTQQLDEQEVRQFELDVFADPAGDLWRPLGRPGFKVFHIEQIDMDSNCEVLVDCLSQVKGWSDVHRDHMPIAFLLEIKDTADIPGPPDALPITSELLADLDDEIRSVFPADRLITPDDVRGSRTTLEEAVLQDGWPTIDESRGKVMFLLDNKRNEYLAGTTTLEGRVAFTPSAPGQPDAAFLKLNDPIGDFDVIQSAVAAGYMVRTRSDLPVETAISGDTSMRDAAFASGAQWVSSDYPVPGLSSRWGTDYVAQIPGGTPARCNPVSAPVGCENVLIENLQVPTSTTSTTVAPTSTSTTATTVATASSSVPRFTG